MTKGYHQHTFLTSSALENQKYRNISTSRTHLQKTREEEDQLQLKLDQKNLSSHQDSK